MTELDRYVPKELQKHSGTFTTLPFHPSLLFDTSRLTKEIEQLRIKITELEAQLEKLADTEAIIQYLQQFKDHFTFYCVSEGHDVTIMRCATILNLGFCNSKSVCKGRKELGKKLNYL